MKKCKIKGLVGDALKRFSWEHVYNDSIIYSLGEQTEHDICFIRFSSIGKREKKYLPKENTQGKTERNEKDSN